MKKAVCGCVAMVCLLSGCTLLQKDTSSLEQQAAFEIEDGATLSIQMDDRAYANALMKLWNSTYPKHKDQLHIRTTKEDASQSYDVAWLSDEQIKKDTSKLYPIQEVQAHIELGIESHLQTNATYFLPMEGKGLVFVYNEEELIKRKGVEKDLYHFEDMKALGEHVYYHNRNAEYVYPFLFTPMEGSTKDWLAGNTLYNNIDMYRKLDDVLELHDDQIEMDTFYMDGSYVCGLLQNDGRYAQSSLYKEGKLHFLPMPDYQGISYAPIVDTYGFVVYKHTKYPKAASAFLQLARSKEGMDQLINTTSKTPIIAKKDLETYFAFDRSQKELIQALNGSQLRKNTLYKNIQDSTFYSDVQNSLYTKESNSSFRKRIKEVVYRWYKK